MTSKKKIVTYSIVIILLVGIIYIFKKNFGPDYRITWGATFSTKYNWELGLNEQEVYTALLEDLKVKTIRLPIYWDELEPTQGKYQWQKWDNLIKQAEQRGVEIMPVLGRRAPRWPECHEPLWVNGYLESDKEQEILRLLEAEVKHFKQFNNIKKWQVDNEPFANFFGDCPKASEGFVRQEIALVKKLDDRPIVLTESGELSTWKKASQIADILGVSMYRVTWNEYWGHFVYPLPPAFYYYKAKYSIFNSKVLKAVVNTELQVEPWATQRFIKNMPLDEQLYSMSLDQVESNIEYAKKSGLDEIYLWGVEWWYWLGKTHNNWSFWELGKQTINNK